jgi:hypothetical protein
MIHSISLDYINILFYYRLSTANFDWLLEKVRVLIEKQQTTMRRPIPADKRLALTLKYLATGASFYTLSGEFVVGECTVGRIVMETSRAIIHVLKEFNLVPNTAEDWVAISENFYQKWDYPNAIGALDGKHILIQKPKKSGTRFHNYKSTFSVVLMGLADADGR